MPEGQCKFLHDKSMKAGGREMLAKIPCPSFKKEGGCRYGATCWMLHAEAQPKQLPSANAASAKLLEQQMEAVASLEALTGTNNVYGNDNDDDDNDDTNDDDIDCDDNKDEGDDDDSVYYLCDEYYANPYMNYVYCTDCNHDNDHDLNHNPRHNPNHDAGHDPCQGHEHNPGCGINGWDGKEARDNNYDI